MRVLALTQRLPYAPNRGDRIRAHFFILELARHFDVELVSLVHDADEASHASDLERHGIRTTVAPVPRFFNLLRAGIALPGRTPLTHSLVSSPAVDETLDASVRERPPDVVFAYCSSMAKYALRPPLAGVPLVFDFVDVDSAKWQALAEIARPPRRWIYAREHRTLGAFERRAAETASSALVVNDRERDLLVALAPGARARVIENGIDVEAFRGTGPPAPSPVAVFCGVMNYGPNEEAAEWVARQVWPLVLQREPRAQLVLVGASPTALVRSLAGPAVQVTGSVPDTRPYLWNAAVGLAPLHTARGIQNKVLEAIAAGLPTVVTSAVARGLPAEVSPACVVADDPASFADAVVALFQMRPSARRDLAGTAALEPLTWPRRLEGFADIFRDAAAKR